MSPLKTSNNDNQYFDLQFQTASKIYRAVCFSPEKHKEFKSKMEATSPVKLLRCQKRKSAYTGEEEIHVNKKSRIAEPTDAEIDFDFEEQNGAASSTTTTTYTDIVDLTKKQGCRGVNAKGRITFNGSVETMMSKGKTLLKQEACFTDETGSIRLVLWESDIAKINSGQTFSLMKSKLKSFDNKNYLTLNIKSIIQPMDIAINRPDDDTLMMENQLKTINCPADAVQSVSTDLSCNSCRTKIVPHENHKIAKCDECGLSQLVVKCKSRRFAQVLFNTEDIAKVSLKLFDDKLESLHAFQPQDGKPFSELSEDDIIELLLTAEGTVVYNSKNNVVNIKQKRD